MPQESKPRFYLPELDGLRFIAFLLVFIHNAPSISSSKIWTALHEYGWVGVDLFFCLSGFLITKLLVTEREQTGKINIRDFYIRRGLRILPLYLLYTAIALAFSIFTGKLNNTNLHLTGILTFTFNIIYLFLTPHIMPFFVHLWTISYEMQFYGIIPWFLKAIVASSNSAKWLVIASLYLLFSLIRAIFIYFHAEHPAIYMLPIVHFESILFGVVIGLGLLDYWSNTIKNWVLFSLGVLCNTLVFLLPYNYEITWGLMLTYSFVGLGMSLIVFSVSGGRKSTISLLLKNPLFVFLGKISYGLYMFHIVSNFLAGEIYRNVLTIKYQSLLSQNLFVFCVGLILTFIVASISYQAIEKPFLRIKRAFATITSRQTL